MNSDEKVLNLFTTRLRELILHYQELKSRCATLQKQIVELQDENERLKEQLNKAGNEYTRLKTAKMITITDGDIDTAKEKIAKLIRDVDKCITMINE